MKTQQKGFAGVVAIIVVIVAIIVGGAYVVMKQEAKAPENNSATTTSASSTSKAKLFLEQMQKDLGLVNEIQENLPGPQSLVGYKVDYTRSSFDKRVGQFLDSRLVNMSNDGRFVSELSVGFMNDKLICYMSNYRFSDLSFVWCADKPADYCLPGDSWNGVKCESPRG